MSINKECILCDATFQANSNGAKYCSDNCRTKALREQWRMYSKNKDKEQKRKYLKEYYIKNRVLKDPKPLLTKEENRELRRLRAIEHREKYPEKIRARQEVRNAIKRGDLVRLPCEKCGKEKTEAHHEDYSKPLMVKWLCKLHHIEADKELKVK